MKKFFALLVVLFLLCSSSTAEVNFNPNDYTSEELAKIYSILSEKLFGCVIVPQGCYVVGTDLPAGKYAILKNSELPENNSEFAHVAIFTSMDDYNKERSYWSWSSDESISIDFCNTLWNGLSCELTDGMVIAIGFGTAGLRKIESSIFNSFWN